MLKRALQVALMLATCAGFGCGDKLYPVAAPEDGGGDGTGGGGGDSGTSTAGTTGGTNTRCLTTPKYADVQPILTKYCTPCHRQGAGVDRHLAPAAYNYDTYAAASATADEALLRTDTNTMPVAGNDANVPPMTTNDKCTFKNWVENGAPQ
ncbi:MAG TPA: hypothetical protein VFH51_07620 [Myxococcota bacterium]|nr:hypothetical protein [Myxococcota bacterium]